MNYTNTPTVRSWVCLLGLNICYHHASGSNGVSNAIESYHNITDDQIQKQMESMKILHQRKANLKLFRSYRDDIVLLANSANNRTSLEAMGIDLIEHNQKIFTQANIYLPEGEEIPLSAKQA